LDLVRPRHGSYIEYVREFLHSPSLKLLVV
jgi:hypothetical protein